MKIKKLVSIIAGVLILIGGISVSAVNVREAAATDVDYIVQEFKCVVSWNRLDKDLILKKSKRYIRRNRRIRQNFSILFFYKKKNPL